MFWNFPQLPAELWALIAHYLTRKEQRKLRGVSAAFLAQSRAEFYNTLKIKADYRGRPYLQSILSHMKQPGFGHHVRNLVVSSEAEYRMFYNKEHLADPETFVIPKNEWRFPEVHSSHPPLILAINEALPCFPNLDDLIVEYDGTRAAYLPTMWTHSSQTITNLTLKFNLPCTAIVKDTLPASFPSFPRLHSFTIDMSSRGGMRPGHVPSKDSPSAEHPDAVETCETLAATLASMLPDTLLELHLRAGRYGLAFLAKKDAFPRLNALSIHDLSVTHGTTVSFKLIRPEEFQVIECFISTHSTSSLKTLETFCFGTYFSKYIP
ncbi:hypothetical protein DL96DRAFT_1647291 [Flagelloscypha sp. PMI_526]|nr:hypothetical protein DL96DRAFT_1647291 [Flagelloscypha sp. PMI_526]